MINNKYAWELIRKQERASAEGYAEDMDNWSALWEEEDTWVRNQAGEWRRKRPPTDTPHK